MKRGMISALVLAWAAVAQADTATGWVERLEIKPPALEREEVQGGWRLQFGDDEPATAEGVPELPSLVRKIDGGAGYRITARLVESETQDEVGVKVAPALRMQRTLQENNSYQVSWVREPAPAVYERDAFWPAELLQVDQAWMGTNRLARLVIRPVQWNPKTEVLRKHVRLVLDLIYQPE